MRITMEHVIISYESEMGNLFKLSLLLELWWNSGNQGVDHLFINVDWKAFMYEWRKLENT